MTSVATNFRAFDALVNFQRIERESAQSFDRLSSGERLRKAADDVIDFSTSQGIRSEVQSLRAVKRQNFEGVSVIQVADRNLEEGINILQRIVELGTRSASDTQGADGSNAKIANDDEFQELVTELDFLNENVRFNDTQVFGTGLSYQLSMNTTRGTNSADRVTVATQPIDSTTLGLNALDITTTAGANVAIANAVAAIESLAAQRGSLSVVGSRITENMNYVDQKIGYLLEQESRIRDTDIAQEATTSARLQLETQTNTAAMAQANLTRESVFQLIG